MSIRLPRRSFLQAGSLALSTLAAPKVNLLAAQSFTASTKDPIRFGIIGVGMEGAGVLANAITLPGVECVAAADLYDGRHTLAKQITGNANLFTTRNYKELLDRKDIHCILAAVPDHWHMRVVVDACNAGKDIYCEKPMTHLPAQGIAMIEAAKRNNRIVQIGSQRVSSALCAKARALYHEGTIGDIEMVELSMGRNSPTGAWVYPPPTDLSPQNLDWDTWLNDAPKIPFSPERFARWRCWKEYGTGVGGDLMVHLISGMLYTLGWNEAPKSAFALGGIFRWKDGRNMPDTHAVLFDYHGIPVYVRLDQGSATPEIARFLGPKGVMETQGSSIRVMPQSGQDQEPSYYSGSFPAKMREAYERQWEAEHPDHYGKEPVSADTLYQGPNWDDLKPHLWNFFEATRTRQPVAENEVFGHHAALACHMANEAYFQKKQVFWNEDSHAIVT